VRHDDLGKEDQETSEERQVHNGEEHGLSRNLPHKVLLGSFLPLGGPYIEFGDLDRGAEEDAEDEDDADALEAILQVVPGVSRDDIDVSANRQDDIKGNEDEQLDEDCEAIAAHRFGLLQVLHLSQ